MRRTIIPSTSNNNRRNNNNKQRYEYIPVPSSGAYAILVGMFKASQNELVNTLTKQQVLDFAIKYSNKSNLSDKSKVWSSMKGLVDKGLIDRQISRDPLYYLLEDGQTLAKKLISFELNEIEESSDKQLADNQQQQHIDLEAECTNSRQSENTRNSDFVPSQSTLQSVSSSFEQFILKSGTYDVILIIDQREKMEFQQIDSQSTKFETRTLACGDFLWIARPKNVSHNDRTKDLVLDYIVERKRLDDLLSSLMDGRFEQQKLRLKNSGIRQPCYLIEDCGRLREGRLTASHLNQAITSIEIHDEMTVERVRNQASAIEYLIKKTRCINKFLDDNKLDLVACTQEKLKNKQANQNEFMTFTEFQTKGAKITNWTVREMFAKHLVQISGMSDKKVAAIIDLYPTLCSLLQAYDECQSEKEKEALLSKLQMPQANRAIGPVVSKRVYAAYSQVS